MSPGKSRLDPCIGSSCEHRESEPRASTGQVMSSGLEPEANAAGQEALVSSQNRVVEFAV